MAATATAVACNTRHRILCALYASRTLELARLIYTTPAHGAVWRVTLWNTRFPLLFLFPFSLYLFRAKIVDIVQLVRVIIIMLGVSRTYV